MKIEVKLVKPEEISLDALVHIQEQSFDDTYIKECGSTLKEDFYGSSYAIAKDGDNVVAYYQFQKPGDKSFGEYAAHLKYLLGWREKMLSEDCDISELIENCRRSSRLPVDKNNHETIAFPGEVYFDESADIFSAELAVLPEYRNGGIATELLRKVKEEFDAQLFALNRKDSVMYKINKKLGANFLFQVGPIFEDGSSLVLNVKRYKF